MQIKVTEPQGRKPEPLIGNRQSMGPGALSDEFLAIAHNVETALRDAGAVPGKDYSFLDLFQLAQPFVLAMFEKGKITEYDYPADQTPKPIYHD